jgi:pyruvate formate lyase activating enzyme
MDTTGAVPYNPDVIGRIHSFESFGAVDGPGIRFVVFMQGCFLRCLYCHNPDSWNVNGGKETTVEELITKIRTYKSFIKNGGVTISGGEPLMQPEFVYQLIQACKNEGFHTAIDTSGAVDLSKSSKAIAAADLILLDIKDIDPHDCIRLSGTGNDKTFLTLDFCEENKIDVWIRHVLLPQYTMKSDKLVQLAKRLKPYQCIKKIELLPYHEMGLYKWEEMGLHNQLIHIRPPTDEGVAEAYEIFDKVFYKER